MEQRIERLVDGRASVRLEAPPIELRPEPANRSGRTIVEGTMSERHNEGRVIAEYREAKSRLDALLREAGEVAERFERLARGLAARPGRLIIGLPDERIENPSEWDIVPSHPLPSIEHLIALTNETRAVGARIDELRERLILMGHADLVEQPNGFFH